MSVTLIIDFQALPEKQAAFEALLQTVKNDLPGTGGCKSIDILKPIDQPTFIKLIEVWESQEAHQSHFDAIVESGGWQHVESHLLCPPVSAYFTTS